MKAVILSDSHKNFKAMTDAIEKESPITQIIHAGDIHSDIEDLEVMYPRIPIAEVKGNNDPFLHSVPSDRFFSFGNVKIFLTHGHNYGVKYSLSSLYKKAAELGADIAIFGHTHQKFMEEINGITLFNPGAVAKGYGVLEVDGDTFTLTHRSF